MLPVWGSTSGKGKGTAADGSQLPRTFSRDATLPSLPLPRLEQTLAQYAECAKPFCTPPEVQYVFLSRNCATFTSILYLMVKSGFNHFENNILFYTDNKNDNTYVWQKQ